MAVDTSENLPPDQRNVEVTFVDYGETSTMKLSDTRKLKQDFLHLPFQAIECCLDRIYPPARAYNSGKFWSSAACDFLTDLAKVCLRQFFFFHKDNLFSKTGIFSATQGLCCRSQIRQRD